jgi:hypothetical protein
MANDGKTPLTDERIKELLGNNDKNQYLISENEILSLLQEVQKSRESPSHTASTDKPVPEVPPVAGRKFRR